MFFSHGATVYRLRGGTVPDPYNPDAQIPENWDEPEVIVIDGAFVAQTSTSMLRTATREQALESKSLFDPIEADIRKGDRIFEGIFEPPLPPDAALVPEGTVLQGHVYTIDGIPPAADSNPWTGWTPPREIPLTRYDG
jgi:hypothetical protein